MTFWKRSVTLALLLGSLGIPTQATQAQSSRYIRTNQSLPAPPQTPPPPNQTRPGGGLNPLTTVCSTLNQNLQALVPVENPVLTATAHPSFLFYSPFGADQVKYGEFSLLLWPGEAERHYQVRFALPETPGIVRVSIPDLPDYALQEGQSYRWYFQLYCKDSNSSQPDLTINGLIQRVALTPERAEQIQSASPEIWYDVLARVADQLQMSPQDARLQGHWRRLLQSIQAEDLAAMPFSGDVQLLE